MEFTHIGDAKTRMEITFPAKHKTKPSGVRVEWNCWLMPREEATIDPVEEMEEMSRESKNVMPRRRR
jgi:hypothetical protein